MEQPQAKKVSAVWGHFNDISENKLFVLHSLVSSCSSQFPLDLAEFKLISKWLLVDYSYYFLQVKCRICSTELSHLNKTTTSVLRHYRARHENEVPQSPRKNSGIQPFYNILTVLIIHLYSFILVFIFNHQASRKQMLDEALLDFILKDSQPLSTVESERFVWKLSTAEVDISSLFNL